MPTGWARQHCSILHLLPVFKVTSSIVRSTDSPGAEALPPALPLEPGHTGTGGSPCHGLQTETHSEESLTQHAALQQLFFPTSQKYTSSILAVTALISNPFCLATSAGYLNVFKELNYRKQLNALQTELGLRHIIIYNFS